VLQTWKISFDRIESTEPQAAGLLSLMAVFDGQHIPEYLVRSETETSLKFHARLAPLHAFSLVITEKDRKIFQMHRLVQLATREWLEYANVLDKWREEGAIVMARTFPEGDYGDLKARETLYPHAREITRYELLSESHQIISALCFIIWPGSATCSNRPYYSVIRK
jgi:hypothetical protein